MDETAAFAAFRTISLGLNPSRGLLGRLVRGSFRDMSSVRLLDGPRC
jgi:hypothetical protein